MNEGAAGASVKAPAAVLRETDQKRFNVTWSGPSPGAGRDETAMKVSRMELDGESISARTPPAAGTAGSERLAPRAFAYLNAQHALAAVVVGSGMAFGVSFLPDSQLRIVFWIVIGLLVASSLAIELPWLNRVHVRVTSYTVTDSYVYIVRGWLWRRSAIVATSRILNVEISQGPLLRLFGLFSVRLMSIMELEHLGPLERDAAERIRATVLAAQTGAPID